MFQSTLGSESHNYRIQNVHSPLLFNRKISFIQKLTTTKNVSGQTVVQLVEALRYKQ